jgi:D-3-phosphoglycerate dehydrogenase
VLIWGRDASREQAARDGYRVATSKQAFFGEADILSLHLRLSVATRGIVTAEDLALMRPAALFVNTSRAELVADGALIEALGKGRPGQAAIDVFETEPLPVDSPLLRIENVLATPHLGYVEKDSYELYFGAAFRNLLDYAAGTPRHILNPAALAFPRRQDPTLAG